MSLRRANARIVSYPNGVTRITAYQRPLVVGEGEPSTTPEPAAPAQREYMVDHDGCPKWTSDGQQLRYHGDHVDDLSHVDISGVVTADGRTVGEVRAKLAELSAEAKAARCRSIAASRARQNVYDLTACNDVNIFGTLTFRDPVGSDDVNPYDYASVSAAMIKWTRYWREHYPQCFYTFVLELHPTRINAKGEHAYHVHFVAHRTPELDADIVPCMDKTGTFQQYRRVKGFDEPLLVYNLKSWPYGEITDIQAVARSDRVAAYITKYITKDLMSAIPRGKKSYWAPKWAVRPKVSYGVVDPNLMPEILNGDYTKVLTGDYQTCVMAEYHVGSDVPVDIIDCTQADDDVADALDHLVKKNMPKNLTNLENRGILSSEGTSSCPQKNNSPEVNKTLIMGTPVPFFLVYERG